MCRHLGYLGPPLTVADAVTGGTHSLARQAWAPQQMRGGGTVNADGYGVCWWSGGAVGRHRSAAPVWADAALGGGAARGALEEIRSPAVAAAVRSATPGMGLSAAACAPFTDGRVAFSHNGVITGWPDSMAGLAGRIPAARLLTMEAATDSVFLWELVRAGLDSGIDPADVIASVVRDVEAAAPGSKLNLLLMDAGRIVATAWRHSLWTCAGPSMVRVASEPTTESGWCEVQEATLVDARPGTVDTHRIGGPVHEAVRA